MAWKWWTWSKERVRAWSKRFRDLFRRTESDLTAAAAHSRGTRLAIVGPPASGKTFIWTFLKSGGTKFVTEHTPTLAGVRVVGGPTTIRTDESSDVSDDLDLMLADSMDVSGDLDTYPDFWDQVLSDAFLVVFLFDVSLFAGIREPDQAEEYRARVVMASKFAGKRIRQEDAIVVLAIGWCDKLDDWSPMNSGPLSDCLAPHMDTLKQIRANLAVNTTAPTRQVEGSLASEEWAHTFIYRIFKEGTRGKV
ncbi:hypothetical protein [Geodermatophilus sp. URMC 64]